MDRNQKKQRLHCLLLALIQAFFTSARSQQFIGVNYGEVADNLPPPDSTVHLLKSTTISRIRLYGVDPAIIRALAGTNISIVVGVADGDIPSLASNPSAASTWVTTNISPFFPSSAIDSVSVGNEILSSGNNGLSSQLLPAMQNLRTSLDNAGMKGIKVSTVHYMSVLGQSDPPSSGKFHDDLVAPLKGILGFLHSTGAPFMINPYPWFAYQSDPRPETLAFCLFQSNPGRVDSGTGTTYTNMFDAQVDAVRFAIDSIGYPDVEIVVAETGWPYRGDPSEAGASVGNAKAYNGNLVAHLKSMAGTPKMPGKPIVTYLFALYDEDLKPGPTSERSFGLYSPNLTMTYDAGITGASSNNSAGVAGGPASMPAAPTIPVLTPSSPATPSPPQVTLVPPTTTNRPKCLPTAAAATASSHLQPGIGPACQQLGINCNPYQPETDCLVAKSSPLHSVFTADLLRPFFGQDTWKNQHKGPSFRFRNAFCLCINLILHLAVASVLVIFT